jgi:uncharacterized protein YecE (DUF72 family)
METRIGISGWRYPPWRGVFYPSGLAQRRELSYASRKLNSIEVNGSFYSLQRPESYQSWHADTPKDFVFSVKGPRYITHIRRLRDCEAPLANFFASGVLHLGAKLGPCLWQLPPSFRFEEERLRDFFELLPRDVAGAAKLARRADRVDPSFPEGASRDRRRLRHALEVRHFSFENPDFIALLRRYDVALVLADSAGKWPYMEDITSNFIYMRLHGAEELYRSGYDEGTLRWWAARLRRWRAGGGPRDALTISEIKAADRSGRDIFVYFDNDVKVRAPFDAARLRTLLREGEGARKAG